MILILSMSELATLGLLKINNFCFIKKYRYRLHFHTVSNFLNFFLVFKGCFNKYGHNFLYMTSPTTNFYHVTQVML